jgi:hypothetical protein
MQVQAFPGNHYITNDDGFLKGVEGSPFLGDWQAADVYFKNGSVMNGLMVRYNVLKNQMMYQEKQQTYVMSEPDSLLYLQFPDMKMVYLSFQDEKGSQNCFFEVAQAGKVNLLVRYAIDVIPANYNVALMSGNKNDVLSLVQKFYLQRGNEIAPINKKSRLIELLADKKSEISSFISKERLSFKKKKDLMQVLEYYEKL